MVKICVVGCLHGELDKVYRDIAETEKAHGFKTELVLCCGDFQALRNPADLASMSVPTKYYALGDFYKYYSGEAKAPVLTVVVGGNHESISFLQELPYGGWLAPNIWYMGYASVVQFKGLRIAGLSGIYKSHDYTLGHYEHPPYNEHTKRSAYHSRSFDVFRLMQIQRRVDICLSHDWPRGVYAYGDTQALLRRKQHFSRDISQNMLGSPGSEQLLCYLQPRYWFSAHLHVKFAANVRHLENPLASTRFLALDKCLPRRDYLQFLDIEPDPQAFYMCPWADWQNNKKHPADPIIVKPVVDCPEQDTEEQQVSSLSLDPEWLSILKNTDELFPLSKIPWILPDETSVASGQVRKKRSDFSVTDETIAGLWENFGGYFLIPENFERTAPPFKPADYFAANEDLQTQARALRTLLSGPQLVSMVEATSHLQKIQVNPQTELICAMLELTHPNEIFANRAAGISANATSSDNNLVQLSMRLASENKECIDLQDSSCESDNEHVEEPLLKKPSTTGSPCPKQQDDETEAALANIHYEDIEASDPEDEYEPGPVGDASPGVAEPAYQPSTMPIAKDPNAIDLPDDDDDDEDE